jgi:hypothetical protein
MEHGTPKSVVVKVLQMAIILFQSQNNSVYKKYFQVHQNQKEKGKEPHPLSVRKKQAQTGGEKACEQGLCAQGGGSGPARVVAAIRDICGAKNPGFNSLYFFLFSDWERISPESVKVPQFL